MNKLLTLLLYIPVIGLLIMLMLNDTLIEDKPRPFRGILIVYHVVVIFIVQIIVQRNVN